MVAAAERADAGRVLQRIQRRHPAAVRLERERERARERGQQSGRRMVQRLVAEAECESVLRETHAVLARLRERHRLRSVFGGIVQRLACAAVAVSVEAATARRSRKRGAEEALAAGEAGQRRSVRQRSGHTGTSAGASRIGHSGRWSGVGAPGHECQRVAAGSEGPRKRPAGARLGSGGWGCR